MEIKSNVRQRRRDRMKNLQTQRQVSHRSSSPQRPNRMDEPEKISEPLTLYDRRLEDPEFVWKHRRNQWNWNLQDPYEKSRRRERESWREWSISPTRRQLIGKLVFCLLLFGLIVGMFQFSTPWAVRGQEIVKTALTEDMNFEQAAGWYERTLQSMPAILPAFGPKQNQQSAVAKFTAPIQGDARMVQDRQGLVLTVPAHTFIQAAATGRVMFAGETQDKGFAVIIQHTGGMQTVYGWLAGCNLQTNDWVKGGQIIGQPHLEQDAKDGKLYFAVKKDNRYIDPMDVISFD